ncbi:MAG: 4'-phosphopantetheinyl transferase superfamily protein [Candidatus Saccharibacteria bacterium]|nr:4'-phosphopantetheinyl transferase superfamily protein [Candidatus Saccharibacteria bacterium]
MKNEYGKPYLKGNPVFFSISHSGPYTICAISDQEIGIDLEENVIRDRIVDRFFTTKEQDSVKNNPDSFAEIWTLKEAYSKYLGTGLSKPSLLQELEISEP